MVQRDFATIPQENSGLNCASCRRSVHNRAEYTRLRSGHECSKGNAMRSGAKRHTGQPANRTEVFGVPGAKGLAGLDSRRCDQSIGQLNTVGECMLFNKGCGHCADRLGKGQYSEPELAERLLYLAGFKPGSGALQKFHQGDDRECPIRLGVDGPGCGKVAAGCPDQNIRIKDHFDFRARGCFFTAD